MFKKVLKRILAVSVASLLLVNAVACGGGGGQTGPATDESAGGGGGGGGGGAAADQDRVLHVSVYGDPVRFCLRHPTRSAASSALFDRCMILRGTSARMDRWIIAWSSRWKR